MCGYHSISTGAKTNLTFINTNENDRNRALEILLYKKEEQVQETIPEPVLYKFNLKRILTFFQREMIFQVEFVFKKKSQLSGDDQC